MRKEKVIKIAALNIGIAALDIIVFSDGLLHIDMSGSNILAAAFGATIIVMSLLIFIVGNYKLLYVKEKIIQTDEIKTIEDYISALEQNYEKKTFVKDIDTILEQIKRFQKKKETINDILLQKFDSTEMTYSKFQGAISDGENLFNLNIKSILNKLNAFDEEDYDQIKKDDAQMKFSKEFIQTKITIYNEYISFVKGAIENNEQILLKLDKVLLEISKLGSLEDGKIEDMSAMKEIDELINNIKWYK